MKPGHTKLMGRATLATSLLAAALLAGCGGSQEQQQNSQGGQGSQAEQTAGSPGGGATTAQGGGAATAELVAATEDFLATLDDAQREQTTYAFEDPLKTSNWSNLPGPLVQRSGVPLSEMTEEQQQAAMAMLEAALSEEGYEKTVGIMVGDGVLEATGGGMPGGGAPPGGGTGGPPPGGGTGGPPPGGAPPGGGTGGPPPGGAPGDETQGGAPPGGGGDLQFGTDLYYVTIFGTPSETEPWMLQFGGHHLGLNLTVSGEDNVLTPSFVGVQPAEYTLDEAGDLPAFVPTDLLGGGTVRPMGDENDLAFELINALDPEQQEQAILDYEVSTVVLGPGEDGRALEPEGLPASEMTAEQQRLLLNLVRQWVGIANEPAAEARMAEIESNLDEAYFAWYGPTTNGEPIYYRVTGPTLHIEFSHEEDVQHIHSIYRDPTDDYGEQSVAR